MKRIFALLALLGSIATVSAQGLTTMTVLDSTGATKTYRMVQDASNRLSYTQAICDPTVGANAAVNCATVSSGALKVDGSGATQPVNGTVTAAQGTAANLNATVVGTGTFATQLTGATNNINNIAGTVSLPTGAATAANQGLITTWAGGTLGAMSNFGTTPGAVLVPAVNANVINTLAAVGNNADGVAAGAGAASPVVTYPYVWNGTTWDRQRNGPYPSGATPYTASATGTTAATTATLAGAASVTTYICGFSIRANATAAATGNATITGVITGTLNFTQWTAPNASGLGVTEEIFSPCVPASGTNQSVAVVSAAPGTGGVVSTTAWGYKL